MALEPISWDRLTDSVADRVARTAAADGGPWLRVAIDGAPAAQPGGLAARIAEALHVRGRATLTVDAHGFLRPASLRLEYGKEDPDAYLDDWQDTSALWREVLNPLDPGGSGTVLPDLRDPVTDRATRSARVPLAEGGVLLLHGQFLLGHWFPFDLSVHLRLSPRRVGTPHGGGPPVDPPRLRPLRGRDGPRRRSRHHGPHRRPPPPGLERRVTLGRSARVAYCARTPRWASSPSAMGLSERRRWTLRTQYGSSNGSQESYEHRARRGQFRRAEVAEEQLQQ